MDVRGPEAFTSLAELSIMERTRPSIIFAALVTRQHTILARSEWKSIPWLLYPERKSAMQRLLDIFADCPAPYATKTAIETNSVAEVTRRQKQDEITATANVLLEELDRFEEDWKHSHPLSVWEVPAPSTTLFTTNHKGASVPTWTTILQYQSLDHANVVVMGKAIRIFLLLLQQAPSTKSQQLPNKLVTAAMVIYRSIDYQLQEIKKGASSHLLFWPVKMAFQVVDPANQHLKTWLMDILNRISRGLASNWTSTGSPTTRVK